MQVGSIVQMKEFFYFRGKGRSGFQIGLQRNRVFYEEFRNNFMKDMFFLFFLVEVDFGDRKRVVFYVVNIGK